MNSLGLWARRSPAGLRYLDLQLSLSKPEPPMESFFGLGGLEATGDQIPFGVGRIDCCSWLSLDPCQTWGQPAPVFSFLTVSPLLAMARVRPSSTSFLGQTCSFKHTVEDVNLWVTGDQKLKWKGLSTSIFSSGQLRSLWVGSIIILSL